jgi:FHA domain-containing protein
MPDLILEVVEGPGVGRKIELTGPLEIGREPGVGIVLTDDDLVSRRHARVSPSDSGAVAEDLGSRNGTFVNGEEVHAPARLDPGDQLLVGVTVMELRSSADVRARPTAVRARPAAFELPPPPALAKPEQAPTYVPQQAISPVGTTLDPLVDARTKRKARLAPVAIFMLVLFLVLIYLATR